MEMREVLSREGREAKNLLVYQFCDETSNNNTAGVVVNGDYLTDRKPPMAPPKSPNGIQTPKNCPSPTATTRLKTSTAGTGPRVRSASTGRDKKSELQARYWALLFGNLQRAVNEIYQTVEIYENISSCQETILVLENYVRDFRALGEWFKVSWDYDSRPLQQRPQSLAWEVRKSNPAPRVRTKSLCSPTTSGKSSPALFVCSSGKTSPCYGILDGHVSPKKMLRAYDQVPKGAMRVNVRELFAATKRVAQESSSDASINAAQYSQANINVDKPYVELKEQYSQTDLDDPHLTLADVLEKMRFEQEQHEAAEFEQQQQAAALEQQQIDAAQLQQLQDPTNAQQHKQAAEILNDGEVKEPYDNGNIEQHKQQTLTNTKMPDATQLHTEDTINTIDGLVKTTEVSVKMKAEKLAVGEPTALQLTVASLEQMENALLTQQANKEPTPPTTEVKPLAELLKKTQPLTTAHVNTVQSSPMKYSSVLNRPAAARTNNGKTSAQQATGPSLMTAAKVNASKQSSSTALATKAAPPNGVRRAINNNNNPNNKSLNTRMGRQGVAQVPPRPSSKTECYGPPNNVASRLSARSRTMLEMNSNAGNAATASANISPTKMLTKRSATTLTTANAVRSKAVAPSVNKQTNSREDIGSSTSTLKASNEQLSSSHSTLKLEERHSEPKQMPSDTNDGWLTVKNRRRPSMHWANRFNQPTGYASLPTLTLLNEQKEQEEMQKMTKEATKARTAQNTAKTAATDSKTKIAKAAKPLEKDKTALTAARPEIKNAKAKVNSFPAQRITSNSNVRKSLKSEQLPSKTNVDNRSAPIKRQKSDLTGLKMTSLHKEYMRSEKNALRKQQQQKDQNSSVNIVSSSETVVEASNETEYSGVLNKIDIKIQTNCEFSKTIGELYESISGRKLYNGCVKDCNLSAYDESDEQNTDDGDEERNERMLVEVQESLERQIRELESIEIDVDTETDETDAEVLLEDHDEGAEDRPFGNNPAIVLVSWTDAASLEFRYQALLNEMQGNERIEVLALLQAYVARYPGRAQHLHQKLSSPSRRRSLKETLKKYQVKQARAKQKRELLQQEKASKLQQLFDRVEVVKTAKKQLIEEKRLKMEGRLQRAAENREQYLRRIIEKAHDEENKLKEINFIKNFEAQNKRLELLESSKETEGRLQELEQERQKRVEEKAAKEAAVERRRQALEKERLLKLEKMNETRLEKEQRIGKMQQQKERQRQAMAREKARDREERMLALQVQKQQSAEELQRKIFQKQQESARRHEENIEHIRQRAVEMTLPTRNVDEVREESEQLNDNKTAGSINEDGDMSSTLSDACVNNKEHSRSYKKKMKKLKMRMSQNAAEYLASFPPLPAADKYESKVPKLLNLVAKGGGNQGMDRTLGNLNRVFLKAQQSDYNAYITLDGLGIITTHVISKALEENSEISNNSIQLAIRLYRSSCSVCPKIAAHALLGNSLATLFDIIHKSIQLPEEIPLLLKVVLSTELMLACIEALASKSIKSLIHPKVSERLPDMINYAVITGLIETLSRRCSKIRESMEDNQSALLNLLTILGFLARFIDLSQPVSGDPTRLLASVKSTELFGTLSMLRNCVVPIVDCLPRRTVSLAAQVFQVYVSLANLDLGAYQEILSIEGPLSSKLLDVIIYIFNCYQPHLPQLLLETELERVIIDMIATVGFFTLNNRKHQDLLVSEQYQVIFKCLSKLPAEFDKMVYPLLVAVCFNNAAAKKIVANHFELTHLESYSKSDVCKNNHLIQLMHRRHKGASANNSNNNSNNKA